MHDHRAPKRLRRIAGAGLASLATLLFASACAVGPDYVRPDMPVPQRFAGVDGTASTAMPAADAEFWHRFDDPLLDRLVDDALLANHHLRIALARSESAERREGKECVGKGGSLGMAVP